MSNLRHHDSNNDSKDLSSCSHNESDVKVDDAIEEVVEDPHVLVWVGHNIDESGNEQLDL